MNPDFDLSLDDRNNCIVEFVDGDDRVCFYKDTTGYPESMMGMVRRIFDRCTDVDNDMLFSDVGEAATAFFTDEIDGKHLVYIISKKTIDREKVDYCYIYNVASTNLEIFLVMGGEKIILDSGKLSDKKFRRKWTDLEQINDTLYLTAMVNHQGKRNRAPQIQEDTARSIEL